MLGSGVSENRILNGEADVQVGAKGGRGGKVLRDGSSGPTSGANGEAPGGNSPADEDREVRAEQREAQQPAVRSPRRRACGKSRGSRSGCAARSFRQ